MELKEIANMLEGIPRFANKVTYRAWTEKTAPPLPFICYLETGSNNFNADGTTYYPGKRIRIELYSRLKDTASEAAIEATLTAAGIMYDKVCDYIESEKCYMTTYEIEV